MDRKRVEANFNVPEDATVIVRTQSPRYLTGKDYLRVFSSGLSTLATDKTLKLTDLRVFIGLLTHVDFNNEIDVTQKILSEELGIAQQEISKSIRKLLDKGYLELLGEKHKQKIYRMNSHVAAKCRAGNIQKLQGEQLPVKRVMPE